MNKAAITLFCVGLSPSVVMLLTRKAWDSVVPTACWGTQGHLPDQAVLCLHQPGASHPRTSIDTQQMDSTLVPEQQRGLVSWEPDFWMLEPQSPSKVWGALLALYILSREPSSNCFRASQRFQHLCWWCRCCLIPVEAMICRLQHGPQRGWSVHTARTRQSGQRGWAVSAAALPGSLP